MTTIERLDTPDTDSDAGLADPPESGEHDSLERAVLEAFGTAEPLAVKASAEVDEQLAAALQDRYVVLRRIGVGGMGTVYEVYDRHRQINCALKTISAQKSDSVLRFKREFRTIAQLRHPNLVRHFDLSVAGDRWFYTMELIDGADLLGALRATSSDELAALRSALSARGRSLFGTLADAGATSEVDGPGCDIAALKLTLAQILDALDFLHQRGIVHRDLKPSNILVDRGGTVRILDFGIARALGELPHTGSTGNALGTLAYISPEGSRGVEVTQQADLYALGCIVFELLSGELPFRGNPLQLIHAHQHQPPPRLSERVTNLPAEWSHVCDALLAKAPDERPTIESLRQLLGLPAQIVPQLAPAAEGVLIGRDLELDRLERMLQRAIDGEFVFGVLTGESGVGKSALARQMANRAGQLGFETFVGRCYERENLPFRAFDQIIDAMALALRGWSREQLRSIAPHLRAAAVVFPNFQLVLERDEPDLASAQQRAMAILANKMTRQDIRQMAFRSLLAIIASVQRQVPVLLFIDDLQWADAESLDLLEALLELRADERVMLVAAVRSDEVDPSSRLGRILGRRNGCETLALTGLPSQVLGHIVRRFSRRGLPPALEALLEQTGGNPFFAVQLGAVLADDEVARRFSAQGRLPELAELLGLRLDELSAEAQRVLELAAAAGGPSALSMLRDASRLPPDRLQEVLDQLIDARLLRAARAQHEPDVATLEQPLALAYDLYHDKTREFVYRRLSAEQRTRAHLALAEALERSEPHQHAEALLRHYRVTGDPQKTAHYLLLAAEQAAEKLAFRRAITLYEELLSDPSSPERGLWEQARLWERLADLLSDELSERESILRARQRAVGLLEQLSASQAVDRQQLAHALRRNRARLALMMLNSPAQIAEGAALTRRLAGDDGWSTERSVRGWLVTLGWLQLRRWGWSLLPTQWFRRDPTPDDLERMAFLLRMNLCTHLLSYFSTAESALRWLLFARRFHSREMQVFTRALDSFSSMFIAPLSARRIAHHTSVLDAVERELVPGPLDVTLPTLLFARGMLHLQDDLELACRDLQQAMTAFSERGLEHHEFTIGVLGWLAYALELAGRYDEVLEVIGTLESRRSLGVVADIFVVGARVRVHARRGAIAEGRQALSEYCLQVPERPFLAHRSIREGNEMVLMLVERRYEEVLERIDRHREDVRQMGVFLFGFYFAHWVWPGLESAVQLHRRGQLSAKRLRCMKRWAKKVSEGWQNWQCLGLRVLALFAAVDGKSAKAKRLLDRAIRRARVLNDPYHLWLCLEASREICDDSELQREADRLRERYHFYGWWVDSGPSAPDGADGSGLR